MSYKHRESVEYVIDLINHYYELSLTYYPRNIPVWGSFEFNLLNDILNEWMGIND